MSDLTVTTTISFLPIVKLLIRTNMPPDKKSATFVF